MDELKDFLREHHIAVGVGCCATAFIFIIWLLFFTETDYTDPRQK